MPFFKGVTEKLSQCIEKMHQQQLSKINKKFSDMGDKENVDTTLDVQLSSISASITYCEQFAISTKKVLLLSGDNFSGKTISTQSLLLKLLQASFDLQILPIYIDLDNVDDIKKPFIEKFLLETYHLTNQHISELKKQDNVLFIFDHYGNKGICVNLYTTQQLASWSGKSIVISDLSHLAKFSDYRPCFIPYHNQRRQPELYAELVSPSPVMQNKTTPIRQKDDGNTKNAASQATPPNWQSTAKQSFENTRPQASPKINRIIEDDELINHPLNERLLTHDENIMRNLADKAKSDLNFRKFLLDLIYKSRNEPRLSKAAANAITALNYAKINLSGLDFSRCHIPGADLRGAILDHTNFSGADLSNVDFQGAWLRKTNVTDAKMDGVHFGEKPYFKLLQPIIKSQLLPDESLLSVVSGSDGDDSSIKIYHNGKKTPMCLEGFTSTQNLFSKIAISIDGSVVAVIDNKNERYIYLLEIYTGTRLKTFLIPEEDKTATAVVLSQDKRILVAGCSSGAIYIFDVISGEIISKNKLIEGYIEGLAINQTNDLLATSHGGGQDALLHLWELESISKDILHKQFMHDDSKQSPLIKAQGSLATGHTVAMNLFSTDGKYLITSNYDVKIWSLVTFKLVHTLKSKDNNTSDCIALSQGNKYLAVGFGPNIMIYHFEDGSTLCSLEGHFDDIRGLMFNSDGTRLMSADVSGIIRFWDSAAFVKKQVVKEEKSEVNLTIISPDNKFLAVASGGVLSLWIIAKWLKLCTIDIDKWCITNMSFHQNSQMLALSGKHSHGTHIFDINTYLTTRQVKLHHFYGDYHAKDVQAETIISLSECVYTPGTYTTHMLGYTQTKSSITGAALISDVVNQFMREHGPVNFIPNYNIKSVALNDNYMVATNSDGSFHIWDIKNPKNIWPIECTCPYKTNLGHEPYLERNTAYQCVLGTDYVVYNKINYIPDEQRFINVKSNSEYIKYNKNEVFVFDPNDREPGSIVGYSIEIDKDNTTDTSGNLLPIVDFVLSHNRRFLIVAHKKKITIKDRQTNLNYNLIIQLKRDVTCVSISPCDRYFSLGFSDCSVEIWRIVPGDYIGHEFSIYQLKGAISNISWGQDGDGLFFVTSSKDNVARCWRLISVNDKLDAMLCWSNTQISLDVYETNTTAARGLTEDDQILLKQLGATGNPIINASPSSSVDDLEIMFRSLGGFPSSKNLKLPQVPYIIAFPLWNARNDETELIRIRQLSSKAAKRFQQGNQAIIEKELDKAITFFQRTIAIEDKICIFHQQLAYCYWLKALRDKNDDYFQQASESLKTALRLEANAKLYIFCALYLYQNKSFHTEALYYLDKAANFLLKHNDYQFHFKEFDKILLPLELQFQIGEKRATTIDASSLGYYLMINIYFFQSERVNANQYLTRFINDVAKNPTAMSYSLLGYCHKLLGNFAEAAYCFVQARDLDGNHPLTEENARECFALAGINIPEENESATVSSSTPDDEDEQMRQAITLSLSNNS